jgi:hypothetical protein
MGWSAKLARPIVLRGGTEPITLADVRAFILGSINCSHGATLDADHMPDDTPIRP